jgi:hypothetical protein
MSAPTTSSANTTADVIAQTIANTVANTVNGTVCNVEQYGQFLNQGLYNHRNITCLTHGQTIGLAVSTGIRFSQS